MERPPDPEHILLIDKPITWTSFDVVKKIRGHFKLKKVGHAGTLDPLATGLLIVCTGKKTKEIQYIMDEEKEYTGTIILGQPTPSHDLETEITEYKDISQITEDQVNNAVLEMTGWISQIPPQHSAIKVKGKRAYESARRGENIILEPRQVNIKIFEASLSNEVVKFRIVCSKGTYIRSIARDLGDHLGVGAHLGSLRRTRIGNYLIENSVTIEDLVKDASL